MHTPGPWAVYLVPDGTWAVAQQDETSPPLAWLASEDDARLIAAAPELLEALKTLRTAWDDYADDYFGDARAVVDAADAALAKVESELNHAGTS